MSIVNYTDLMEAQKGLMGFVNTSPEAMEKVNAIMPEIIQMCENCIMLL